MRFLFLVPICLGLAIAFIIIEKMEKYVVADAIKGVASAFFVLLGILGAAVATDASFARTVVLGLLLGAIADVLLNLRYVYEGKKAQLAFLAGIVVFLLGHLVYIAACLPHCKALVLAIIAGVVLTALLMYWIFENVEATMVFKVFGVFYVGAVVILNCIALVVLAGSPNAHWMIFFAGTLLFLVSDVILIINNFGPRPTFAKRVANLMLYYVGQLLIALCLQLPL